MRDVVVDGSALGQATGAPLDRETVRALLLLRARTLAAGWAPRVIWPSSRTWPSR